MKITPKKIGLIMSLLTGALIALSGSDFAHAIVMMPVMWVISTLIAQGFYSSDNNHSFFLLNPAASTAGSVVSHDHDENVFLWKTFFYFHEDEMQEVLDRARESSDDAYYYFNDQE